MKVGSFPSNVIPITTAVRSKRGEGDGGGARSHYDPNQSSHDSEQGDDERRRGQERPGFDPKLIDEALEAFRSDASAQESGLSATIEGSGPGLRVHVKDCNGTTLRQFSGEEFLQLRVVPSMPAGAVPSGLRRGKILDQKL